MYHCTKIHIFEDRFVGLDETLISSQLRWFGWIKVDFTNLTLSRVISILTCLSRAQFMVVCARQHLCAHPKALEVNHGSSSGVGYRGR